LKELRCEKCGKLLATANVQRGEVRVRCIRCKHDNIFNDKKNNISYK